MEMQKNENEPIYDDKVKNVIRLLTEGINREEIASQMGYSTFKSIDMYFRRRNFHWDSDKQNYEPSHNSFEDVSFEDSIAATSKVAQVISLFSKDGADSKVIAKRLGFSEHREMASYMAGKGYQWSIENMNYTKTLGLVEESVVVSKTDSQIDANLEENKDSIVEMIPNVRSANAGLVDLQQFVPILMMLQKNKDRLVDMLIPQSDENNIPRYALPGVFVTKSVHMISPLDIMVRDFSKEKNVSQKDIFATALLEFFKDMVMKEK